MGLDISCSCGAIAFRASSYSGFHTWRKILASKVGVNLEEMIGFGGNKKWTKKEPFYELLNHSDCDGFLTVNQCSNLVKDFHTLPETKSTLSDAEQEWFLQKLKDWQNAVQHSVENKCKILFQ